MLVTGVETFWCCWKGWPRSSCFTGNCCAKSSWTLFCVVVLRHCPVFLPKIVICLTTACEKVNFERQKYELSENEKICWREITSRCRLGISQKCFGKNQNFWFHILRMLVFKIVRCDLVSDYAVTTFYSLVNQGLVWWTLCSKEMQWEMHQRRIPAGMKQRWRGSRELSALRRCSLEEFLLLIFCISHTSAFFSAEPSDSHFGVLKEWY